MTRSPDLLVVGGGPAGVGAAVAAAERGLAVTLFDEAADAGGQVYRAPPPEFRNSAPSVEERLGDDLRARLRASSVRAVFNHLVWSVSGGFRVDALGPEGGRSWIVPALIVATGAQERVVPFPGWTLPGVYGLAATTILLKSQRMLPGSRTLVAGCGPLLAAVAVGILKAGGSVAAVVDIAGPRDWLSALPAMASCPDLLTRGACWVARIRAAGVPILPRQAIAEIHSTTRGLQVTVGAVDAIGRLIPGGRQRQFEADSVAVGHGLAPSTDVTRLLRAKHAFDSALGAWRPQIDECFRTSVPGFYVAGDGAGISGAAAAYLDGAIAGLTAARDLGRLEGRDYLRLTRKLRRRAAKARRFGHAMARLMALRHGQVAGIPADTVICRCEDVTRAEIESAIADGAVTMNQIKAWTRCGMGPCQGRMCGDVAGSLLAQGGVGPGEAGMFSGRSPFRPLPLDQIAGAFEYADIALPPSAPL